MKALGILIGGKVVNGLFGLLLFHVIKTLLFSALYIDFSKTFALLTLMATFTGGAISGLMLKRGFNSAEHAGIVRYWVLFFIAITVLVVELMMAMNYLLAVYRVPVYVYLFTNLLAAVALIDYQMKQQFLRMTLLDTGRLVVPLLAMVVASWLFKTGYFGVTEVLWYLNAGNVFGVYLFLRTAEQQSEAKEVAVLTYMRGNWRADLWFGLWFSAFNALFQVLVTLDRQLIARSFPALQASRIAYTADQVCRVANGIIFPVNTKISSQLGAYIRQKQFTLFYKNLRYGTWLSLGLGTLLTAGWYVALQFGQYWQIDTGMVTPYALLYTGTTALYLAALILQKRFDYTRFKAIPVLLLLLSLFLGYTFLLYFPVPIYVLTTALFFGFMLIASSLDRHKLAMDR